MNDINQKFLNDVGGSNLLLKSDDLNESSRAPGITTSKIDDDIYKNVLKVNNPNLASYITISAKNYTSYPTPNKDFTVSFLVKGKTGKGKKPDLTFYYNTESGYQKYPEDVSENEYKWISLTFNLNNTVPNNHINVSNFSELYIARMKVEFGNKLTDWTTAPEDINIKKYVKNTRYEINKILAYYYPSVKGSEKDTYLFLKHLNNSIYTTNYKIALCLTLIENGKFNMTRFQELKSKIDHLSKYIYSLETLIRYTLENKIYIKD